LAIVAGGVVLFARPLAIRFAVRWLVTFALGALPAAVAIVVLNRAMHGGALESGYGKLGDLFTMAHVAGNLQRYPRWLIETQTPFVLLCLAAPWVLRRSGHGWLAWWLLAFAATTVACYIPYTVWDAWWFLRFLLPAFPPLLILSSAVAVAGLVRLTAAWRTAALVAGVSGLLIVQVHIASTGAVFELRHLEARFRAAGEYVARRLPANAVVFTVTQSGSVRFYSGRQTLIWSALDPAWLDRAIEFLRAEGFHPYFLFEADEEPLFKEHVGASSPVGQLDWPPLADIDGQVRIYDPADRLPYRSGAKVQTDFFWSPHNPRARRR